MGQVLVDYDIHLCDNQISPPNSSKSSDSTAKRYDRDLNKAIKDIGIGNDDITNEFILSHLQYYIQSRRNTEIPEKYRYPLRKVGKENIQKLNKLIADLKIKYPRSSSSNGS